MLAAELSPDPPSLVLPGTLILENYCYFDIIIPCLFEVDVTISGSSVPSLSGITVDTSTVPPVLSVDTTLLNFSFTGHVTDTKGPAIDCEVVVTYPAIALPRDIVFLSANPQTGEIDAAQAANALVSFGTRSDSTDCDDLGQK